jgi:hypothetical protein
MGGAARILGSKQCWQQAVLAATSAGSNQCWQQAALAVSSAGSEQCWQQAVLAASSEQQGEPAEPPLAPSPNENRL